MPGMREKQSLHLRKISVLMLVAFELGYELTQGDAYRDPRATFPYSHPNSVHKLRLANDLIVFKDGQLIEGEAAEKAHNELHDIWDKMGGAKRITNDLNHYSTEHNGMR